MITWRANSSGASRRVLPSYVVSCYNPSTQFVHNNGCVTLKSLRISVRGHLLSGTLSLAFLSLTNTLDNNYSRNHNPHTPDHIPLTPAGTSHELPAWLLPRRFPTKDKPLPRSDANRTGLLANLPVRQPHIDDDAKVLSFKERGQPYLYLPYSTSR